MKFAEMRIEIITRPVVVPSRTTDIDGLTESIATVGLLGPVIVDRKHVLIDGHRRLAALDKLGMRRVLTVVYEGSVPWNELFFELNMLQEPAEKFSMTRLQGPEYEVLKQSIKRYGLIVPISVDSEGNVVDGHRRIMACAELGLFSGSSQAEFLKENAYNSELVGLRSLVHGR